ncbi:MAG: mannitol dehydrogenase family protein [Thiolinea sp.]
MSSESAAPDVSPDLPSLMQVSDAGHGVQKPAYVPAEHGAGILHIGVGAFHRAHQAVYTDSALAEQGGDWRIIGANLRSAALGNILNRQNGLYTLLEKGRSGTQARLIGSISQVIAARETPDTLLQQLSDPVIRIVSLTVTEKAYGIVRPSGEVNPQHDDIAYDLAHPQQPRGVIGLLVEGLRLRRDAGVQAFTVLCCDNLPANGHLLQNGVLSFARQLDSGLADWIAANVAFPSTMVDRITPAATQETRDEVAQLGGYDDQAALESESFSQWVIEDHFPAGRPYWEAGGALFVADVEPYEQMKLRMLNGTHSMLAYAGFLRGCTYVRDVMADPVLKPLVERHLQAAAATLSALPGIDFADYAAELVQRFENPAIAHETYQIAMDGTEKLPQRLLEPAEHALQQGQDLRPFAYAVAAWMRYCLGVKDDGTAYALRDPREAEIRACLSGVPREAVAISQALQGLSGLFPESLTNSSDWQQLLSEELQLWFAGAGT